MGQTVIAGVSIDLNDEGYFTNSAQWTKDVAIEMAKTEGIAELSDKHLKVLEFLRSTHASGVPLTIRKVGNSGICDIKEFYALFPGAPLKKSSKLAGIPKPVSCV